jgi:flagellin
MVTAINGDTASTGVSASLSGNVLVMNSTDLGSSSFVSVKALVGSFGFSSDQAKGVDASVTVNGAAADVDGTSVDFHSGSLDLSFNLASGFNGVGGSKTFGVTGGGATFAIGSKVTAANDASIGIGSVSTGTLGSNSLGYLSSLGSGGTNAMTSGDLTNAQKILDKATSQVSSLRGRIGAFQTYTIGSTVNSLNVALENSQSAQSAISDTDFSAETANLTRAEILSSAAQSVLKTANSTPQSVLSLLQ